MSDTRLEVEKNIRHYNNLVVLSNAAQLTTDVIRKIAGEEIADGVNGEEMKAAEISATVTAKLGSYLDNPTKTTGA